LIGLRRLLLIGAKPAEPRGPEQARVFAQGSDFDTHLARRHWLRPG
jgi:hypothetical protein